MRMNMVFNLESIKELQELTKALESAATVLDLARMKQEIQELDITLKERRKELNELAEKARRLKASLEPPQKAQSVKECEPDCESAPRAVTMSSRSVGLSERR